MGRQAGRQAGCEYLSNECKTILIPVTHDPIRDTMECVAMYECCWFKKPNHLEMEPKLPWSAAGRN